MKSTNSTTVSSAPETKQPFDGLVDDLLQQDVLPTDDSLNIPDEPINGGMGDSGKWDEPVGSHGTRAPRTGLEDEVSANELLVNEGLNEAEEELRDIEEEDLLESESENE